MKQFFKYFFASSLAMLVIGGILVIILLAGIAGIVGSVESGSAFGVEKKDKKVKENSILHFNIDKTVGERTINEVEFDVSAGIRDVGTIGLNEISAALEKARKDDNIKGIFIDMKGIPAGMASLEYIRKELVEFKDSCDKFIYAYSEVYSQKAYYLATVADKIYLNPVGAIDYKGLSAELMFFKHAIDKLEVDVQVIRGSNNKFKSAVEPYMYDKMSDANRTQYTRFLNSFWDNMLLNLSEARSIDTSLLNDYASSLIVSNPDSALHYKMIDGLLYYDEVVSILQEASGYTPDKTEKDAKELNLVGLHDYGKKALSEKLKNNKNANIAIVYAVGSIVDGKGSHTTIGSETLSQQIKKARENDSIKAVVLRVNSPGGSALASDVIWREILLTKKKKPFVISMGDLAASGGYYISCLGDRIFAEPTTITGSIGVFGVIPNFESTFNNKLGITFDRVKTNTHADIMSVNKPLDEYEFMKIQNEVDRIYDDFISKVADGRGLTKEHVDSIGQGRVWSGLDAIEIGLVDEIGGIESAIAFAAEKAGIEKVEILELPEIKKDPIEKILEIMNKDKEASIATRGLEMETLNQIVKEYQFLKSFEGKKSIQAKMPFTLIIE